LRSIHWIAIQYQSAANTKSPPAKNCPVLNQYITDPPARKTETQKKAQVTPRLKLGHRASWTMMGASFRPIRCCIVVFAPRFLPDPDAAGVKESKIQDQLTGVIIAAVMRPAASSTLLINDDSASMSSV
jgi:hypothetical protein